MTAAIQNGGEFPISCVKPLNVSKAQQNDSKTAWSRVRFHETYEAGKGRLSFNKEKSEIMANINKY